MNTKSFSASLMSDARDYLSRHLGGVDTSSFDNATIRACVAKIYEGGWDAYEADFRRFYDTTSAPAKAEPMSPIKLKASVEYYLGRKLKMYDEIISANFADDMVKIVLNRADVDYRTRRDVIRGYTIELHVFTRNADTGKWHHESIAAETPAQLEFIKWGAVNTPERDAVIREQVETCFRPGTAKAPMKGWIARAEISWEQAHADEIFPKHTTRTA